MAADTAVTDIVTLSASIGAALMVRLVGAVAVAGLLTKCLATTLAIPFAQLPVGAVTLALSTLPVGNVAAAKLKLDQVFTPNLAYVPV